MKTTVTSDWFLATNFIEIQQSGGSLTLLTAGLPYHRRTSRRMIDNLLIVGNEQKRKFRLGVGSDLRYPLIASQNWLTPSLEFETQLANENNSAGWLFHFDCKNILVTWWQPIMNADCLTGVQIRLRETEGRAGKLNLRCCRNIESAQRVNFSGDFLRAQEVDDSKDKLPIEFVGWDYFQIKINWEI
jgi:alpha-mannosidase